MRNSLKILAIVSIIACICLKLWMFTVRQANLKVEHSYTSGAKVAFQLVTKTLQNIRSHFCIATRLLHVLNSFSCFIE
jgi:hypothetical protein